MREWLCRRFAPRTLSEIKLQMKLAGPMCATYLLQVMVDMITLIMVGHIGEVQLAAAAYGNFYVNSTGFAILQGMCSAIDTLASQAFGARNFPRVGAIAQRGVLILGLLCTAQGILWAFSGPILSSLGQDPEVVHLAARYVQVRIPELPAAMLFEVAKRSLQAQGIVNPPAFVTGATIAVHALASYVLTFHTSWGFWGATASGIFTRWAQAIALLAYIWLRRKSLSVVTVADLRRVASAEGGESGGVDNTEGGSSSAYKPVQGGSTSEEPGLELTGGSRANREPAAASVHTGSAVLAGGTVDAEHGGFSDSDSESGAEGGGASAEETRGMIRKPQRVQAHSDKTASTAASGDESSEGASVASSGGGAASDSGRGGSASDRDSDSEEEAGTAGLLTSTGTLFVRSSLNTEQLATLSLKRLQRLPGDTVLGTIWSGWVWRDALSGWGAFVSLGVPGAVMATLDWASFEALAVITGLLGVTELAAHTVLAQIGSLSFLVPYGIAVASSVRVGQAMGRGDAAGALLSARVSWGAGVAWGGLNFLLVVPTAPWWPYIFTSDEPVAALATSAAWSVALFSVLDSLQQLNVGILKGIGQQCVGMVVYPLAYLGVGLPLAYALAHPAGLGVPGVWLGETLGAAVAVTSLASLLAFRYNWTRLAEQCHALASVQQA